MPPATAPAPPMRSNRGFLPSRPQKTPHSATEMRNLVEEDLAAQTAKCLVGAWKDSLQPPQPHCHRGAVHSTAPRKHRSAPEQVEPCPIRTSRTIPSVAAKITSCRHPVSPLMTFEPLRHSVADGREQARSSH
eukprot:CAMPEP_0174948658 /NCGR_PEP_ID=MMETSP1355-20121228/89599_1 /TAXON_ID=464990 /ORGANISM="Hemiselmis tepida, Strain CCMP443" /LENGTH=132 /DNA_ID=CAMNT_0016196185 /DNA_START=453 /DNA_END=849 /DNA_ORIENTATION=+